MHRIEAEELSRCAAPCLDVRDETAFATSHLAGSGHIPAAELRARRGELPARGVEFVVVAEDGGRAESAARELAALGYVRVAWLDAAPDRWPDTRRVQGPAARLWRPSPFLAEVLDRLPKGRALDLAAGAGREAVTLARAGWTVDAWDNDVTALDRATALATRQGVTLGTRIVDLETPGADLPLAEYEVVMVFRFLHRPLFPAMAAALKPGGVLLMETFRRGQERFGRPKHARFLLEDGELAESFPTLETLRYEEPESPEGPVLARLLARRPQGS